MNLNGSQICFLCKEEFIAITNDDNFYSICVSCPEWIKGLTVAKAPKPEPKENFCN